MVFSIQTENGALDVYKQDISWEWKNIRFTESFQDQFSTDITLPKTNNNCNLLNISGLLDSTSQLFGNHIQPCVLEINGALMDVYIQVVSITDDDINVCLYERTLPAETFNKTLNDIHKDTQDTIYVWSVNTDTAYTSDFRNYYYGSPFNDMYAQKHPVKQLDWVINAINNDLQNFTLPTIDDSLYLMASRKTVCPQNPKQVIEFVNNGDDDEFVMVGGQHVVNDLEGWDGFSKVGESTTKALVFNKDCKANLDIYFSWGKKVTTGSGTYSIGVMINGTFEYGLSWNTQLFGKRNGYQHLHLTNITINKGDVISLKLGGTTNNPQDKFELLTGVLDLTYTDYEITDDDYGENLVYCCQHPVLRQWFPNDSYLDHIFDGRTENYYIYNWDGSLSVGSEINMNFPWLGISYFGYWCNIGDLKLKDLYYGLCWLYSKKLVRDSNQMMFDNINEFLVLENANIIEILPNGEYLGQETNVSWCGDNGLATIDTIDNVWLSNIVKRHESPFEYIKTKHYGLAWVDQYEITSTVDSSTNQTIFECNYEEPEGIVLLRWGQYGRNHTWGLIPPPNISNMGLDKITQYMQVTIESFDSDVIDKDYVYLDGRKFLVVEGDMDMNTKQSTLTALLVPTE